MKGLTTSSNHEIQYQYNIYNYFKREECVTDPTRSAFGLVPSYNTEGTTSTVHLNEIGVVFVCVSQRWKSRGYFYHYLIHILCANRSMINYYLVVAFNYELMVRLFANIIS